MAVTIRDACRAPQTSILAQHEADETRSGSGDGLPVGAYVTRGQSIKKEKGSREKGEGSDAGGRGGCEGRGGAKLNARHDRGDRQRRTGERNNKQRGGRGGSGRVKGPQEEEGEEEEATHWKKGGGQPMETVRVAKWGQTREGRGKRPGTEEV